MDDFNFNQYVGDVLSGKRVVCEWVKRACERHVRDLEHGKERGIQFDEAAAKVVIAFFGLLKHSKGEWGGRPVVLEPWQQWVVAMLFGWKRADGTRRFRTAYLEVARKNGKTTLAAGLGLYMMVADGEPGAEVYAAATKLNQARICHSEATRMVSQSQVLSKRISPFKDNLSNLASFSKFEPLGRDSDTLDGLNPHGVLADELHAWHGRGLWDILETAVGARRQPLMLAITTAGVDRTSLCYQFHEYTKKILDGLVEDDSFFGAIYSLDEQDDWEKEENWVKANPNLGVSKKLDTMKQEAKRAKEMPSSLSSFLRLQLSMWSQATKRWMNPEKWRACNLGPIDEATLTGRPCYSGLDLASRVDLAALVHVFPPVGDDDPYLIVPRFFIPEEAIEERTKRDRVPYAAWLRAGLVFATPGNVIDYDFIHATLDDDSSVFDLREVAYDRWGAVALVNELMDDGYTMVEFGQGFASMSSPTKELEAMVLSQKINHGGNAVLSWMMDNVVVRVNPAGDIKPDKERSREKIDGVVSMVMGLDRSTRHRHLTKKKKSIYEERGVRTLGE